MANLLKERPNLDFARESGRRPEPWAIGHALGQRPRASDPRAQWHDNVAASRA